MCGRTRIIFVCSHYTCGSMGLQSQQLFATNIDIGAVAINIQQLSLVPRPLSVSREKRGGRGGSLEMWLAVTPMFILAISSMVTEVVKLSLWREQPADSASTLKPQTVILPMSATRSSHLPLGKKSWTCWLLGLQWHRWSTGSRHGHTLAMETCPTSKIYPSFKLDQEWWWHKCLCCHFFFFARFVLGLLNLVTAC